MKKLLALLILCTLFNSCIENSDDSLHCEYRVKTIHWLSENNDTNRVDNFEYLSGRLVSNAGRAKFSYEYEDSRFKQVTIDDYVIKWMKFYYDGNNLSSVRTTIAVEYYQHHDGYDNITDSMGYLTSYENIEFGKDRTFLRRSKVKINWENGHIKSRFTYEADTLGENAKFRLSKKSVYEFDNMINPVKDYFYYPIFSDEWLTKSNIIKKQTDYFDGSEVYRTEIIDYNYTYFKDSLPSLIEINTKSINHRTKHQGEYKWKQSIEYESFCRRVD